MTFNPIGLFAGAAFSVLSGAAFAADTYTVDPSHAWVMFEINHAGWSQAQGIVRDVAGTIVFDKDDVTKSVVDVTLDATSVDTFFAARNDHVQSPDFLNGAEFPQMTFKSTAIEKTGDKTGKMTGDFTMLGVTVPVTLDVVWSGQEVGYPWAADVIRTGFTATGVIKPADFGMVKVAENGLGAEIAVSINIEGEKK